MTVYVLLREDQNDCGYVDVTIEGVFREKADATSSIEGADSR